VIIIVNDNLFLKVAELLAFRPKSARFGVTETVQKRQCPSWGAACMFRDGLLPSLGRAGIARPLFMSRCLAEKINSMDLKLLYVCDIMIYILGLY